MKKVIFSILSISLLAGGISSCAKSSKGKMSNDWKIDNYEVKTVETENNGDKTITTTSMSGSTVTMKTEDAPASGPSTTTTQTGVLNDGTYTIKKDGTWTMGTTFTFTSTPSTGVTIVSKYTNMQSGTWAFVGKNKEEDFKKNERVLFNTLSSSSTTSSVTTIGGSSSTTNSSSSDTYLSGENTMIYTVTESKSKELKLSSDANHSSTSGSNTNNVTSTATISLVK